MDFTFPTLSQDFYLATGGILILGFFSLMAMLQSVFKSVSGTKAVGIVLFGSLIAALGMTLGFSGAPQSYLAGAYLTGHLTFFAQTIILGIALTCAAFFAGSHLASKFFRGEIASLYLMIITGMLVMVATDDMVTLFVALELASIGLYALIGYIKPSQKSQEGAIKYFVLGSVASAIMLFGFALLYCATGSLKFSEVVMTLPKMVHNDWAMVGALFALVGLTFKLALAPFHLWAPDAYEGAPTGITALMATGIKAMMLVVTVRIFAQGFEGLSTAWLPLLTFGAGLSMIVGNIMALVQNSLKRMFAYSSIAHSGYMALAICAMSSSGVSLSTEAVLFYIISYSLISLGVFGVIMWLENAIYDNLLVDDLSGLAKKHPWAAFALTVFMFSFAGMPPTVGFFAKFFVFNAALAQHLYGLVIVGVIGSSISMFYYLRVIVRMYMTEPTSFSAGLIPAGKRYMAVLIGAALVAVIVFGTIMPGQVMHSLKPQAGAVAQR